MRIYEIDQVWLHPFYRWGKRSSDFKVTELVVSKPESEQRASLSHKPEFSHSAYICSSGTFCTDFEEFWGQRPQLRICALGFLHRHQISAHIMFIGTCADLSLCLLSRSLRFPWLASWHQKQQVRLVHAEDVLGKQDSGATEVRWGYGSEAKR